MDTKTEEKTNNLPESPASATTKIKSPKGFEWLFTIRDEHASVLSHKMRSMEDNWTQYGFTPVAQNSGYKRQDAPKVTKPCTIHNVEMTQKTSKKSGKLYFSHYIGQFPNGTMCFGEDERNTQQNQNTSNYSQAPHPAEDYSLRDIDF